MSGGRGPGGYPGQGYGAPDYGDDPGRGRPRRPVGQPPGYGAGWQGEQGYDDQAYRQGQYGTGSRRPPRGPDQRAGYDQRGGYEQRGYDDRDQGRGDNSFMPGFGGRGEYDDPRTRRPAPGREDRYDRDDRRRMGPAEARGVAPGDRGDRGDRGEYGYEQRGYDRRGNDGYDNDDNYDDWNDGRDRDRQPRKKATRWLPRILVLAVVAALVIGGLVGGLYVYHKYEGRYHPADYAGAGTGDVTVQVMSGDTAFSLAPRLVQLGVVASTRAFENAADAATSAAGTNSAGLEAGYYQLHEHMKASLAYAALINPKNRVQTTVTIPEGKRAVDVIAIIANKTKIPLTDFQQVLAHPSQLGLPSYANGKVEGYLFPATYAIVPHETALQILQAMVQRFNVQAQQDNLAAEAKSVGLTPTQLIIEASLCQAEGGSVTDYPKIAEVIHNRLAKGMHLQFDSTVLYGLGKYAVSATFKQINTPGPYNTYLNAGLPAGPISNPGDAAIQGVLHPAQGDFLYFLTKPGGKSQFSATPLSGQ